MRWTKTGVLGLILALGMGIFPPVLEAQATGGLDGVERAMGRADFQEARRLLATWKTSQSPGASHGEREQALWLEARLEVDPDRAEPLYRRLVLEYPGGRWSDQALQHLALLAETRGDTSARDRWLQTLIRDYPASPLRDGALQRLERAGSATSTSASAPPTPPQSATESASPGVGAQGRFTLQIGAFSDASRARALEAELRARGLPARVAQISGSDLFRVRVGQYATRELAATERESLVGRGLLPADAGVRDDADQERPLP
jgi:hypothetical protein